MKHLLYVVITAVLFSSCIEDRVSSSPNEQPVFSVDTLDFGEVFKGQVTPTAKFMVYNRHDKIINISNISLRDDAGRTFRLNVDGTSGSSFQNIEVRPNDSIYVMVEATVPKSEGVTRVTGTVDFVTNGNTRSVVLAATGLDVQVLKGLVIERDTVWTADIPRQIVDSLVVAPGATLTISGGTELLFHAGAHFNVRGRLITNGTPGQPVIMTGDRKDNVVADIPFDVMSGQWSGLTFHSGAGGSRLSHTVIKNMSDGVMADSVQNVDGRGIELINCRIRNSDNFAFTGYFSDITAVGTEFSDAGQAPLLLCGGNIVMTNVTVANYFLFSAIGYPGVTLTHYNEKTRQPDCQLPLMNARFENCIFYGLGTDFNAGELDDTNVWVNRCLFKSQGSDDTHFTECLWDMDPLYYTVREDYVFDYRLRPDSPAIGVGTLCSSIAGWDKDFYGTPRAKQPAIGAFEYVAPQQ